MSLTYQVAREHQAELLHAAELQRQAVAATERIYEPVNDDTPIVALRLAGPDDAAAIRRLAALDSAPVPVGQVLLAAVDGEPVAAFALAEGRVVADPFIDTRHAVALLRLRADHLHAGPARSRLVRARAVLRPASR